MKKFLLYTGITLLTLLLIMVIVVLLYFNYITKDTRLDLNTLERAITTEVLDSNDNLLNKDSYLAIDDIPKLIQDSFVAVEDKRYYSHNGIDIKRMFSALHHNIKSGKHAQGASTITQQFIKNTFLTNKKTLDRKLKEIKLAILLERQLSKDEILERYLNSLYFGNGIYGIKDAALELFGKALNDLNISEIATLVGIIKAPTYYSPLNDISRSKSRRDVVLHVLRDNGIIDENAYKEAINSDITINNNVIHNNIADFYTRQACIEGAHILGLSLSEFMAKGFRVGTYYEEHAQKSVVQSVDSIALNNENNALALLSDNNTNGITACYGLKNIDIYSHYRQVGSIIKPIAVYIPALENGTIYPCKKYNDAPINIDGYTPHNYGDKYRGKVSIREAIAHSSNVIAVSVLNEIGIEYSKSMMSNMDIDINDNGLAIALGGLNKGLNPIEIISAYETMANGGEYAPNTFIRYIQDVNGQIIYRHKKDRRTIFNPSTAYLMTDMLRYTAQCGTAKKLSILPFEIASKTGTVSSIDPSLNTDVYNVSYTTQNTCLTWIGGNLEANIQGGGLPTIMAREIYSHYYDNNNPQSFSMPNSVEQIAFDRELYEKDGSIYRTKDEQNALYDIFDSRYLPKDSMIMNEDIVYEYIDDILTLSNIQGANIKIYRSNLLYGDSLYYEEYNTLKDLNIRLIHAPLTHYRIEISLDDRLIKTMII